MSGFEVIGLVLALYPCLIDGLKAYKKFRSGQMIENLVKSLKVEQLIYSEFVEAILQSAVSEAELIRLTNCVSEKELVRLDDSASPFLRLWKATALQLSLNTYFGPEKGGILLSTIRDIQRELEAIERDVSGRGQSNYITRIAKDLRHSRRGSSFRERINQLHLYNERLNRLLAAKNVPMQRRLWNKAPPYAEISNQEYDTAEVYEALRDSYRCECEGPHSAKLGLPQLRNLVLPANKTHGLSKTADACLKLLFSIDEEIKFDIGGAKAVTPVASQESVEPQADPISDPLHHDEFIPLSTQTTLESSYSRQGSGSRIFSSVGSDTTLTSSVASRGCAVSIVECAADREDTIQDLCNAVRNVGDCGTASVGILNSKRRRTYDLRSPQPLEGQVSQTVVSLDEIFASNQEKLPRQYRIELALRLSSAVLQLYSTPWITATWSWNDFSTTKPENQQKSHAYIFIGHKFYSRLTHPSMPKGQAAANFWTTCISEPILIRLGVALVELALGKRLAQVRTVTGNLEVDPDMHDCATARNLLDSGQIRAEEGQAYESVVQACLRQQYRSQADLSLCCLNSSEASFQKDAQQAIIGPLQGIWNSSWGDGSGQVCF